MNNEPVISHPIWNGRNFILNKNMCFVIMPFNYDWSETIYEYLEKITKKFSLELFRGDSVKGVVILEDIWRLINEARIIIADISDNNPNVFYELGIVHTLGKPVILITKDINLIPFDISGYRHIIYKGDSDTYDILDKQLSKHIETIFRDYPTGDVITDDTIKRMKLWKIHGYDYDYLLKKNKLRLIKKYSDIEILPKETLTYCLISSIYYGMTDHIVYWTNLNRNNSTVGQLLGLYVSMPLRRPRFRTAFIIKYLSKNQKSEALDVLKKESPNSRLIKHIENDSIKEYIKKNKNELFSDDRKIGIQLLNELNYIEKTMDLLLYPH